MPYNPKTGDQGEQRDHLKNANLAWHTDGYSDLDKKAWRTYAEIQKRALSGYNIFLSERINASKDNKTWAKLTNYNIYDINGGGFKVDINVESDLDGILYIGTSMLSMFKEFEGSFSVNKYTFTVTGLAVETKYYFYIKNTSVNEEGRTGIYSQKTEVSVPIIIDIGPECKDRAGGATNSTIISKANPANDSGKITEVSIWMEGSGTAHNIKVAIFYEVGTNKFTTRDWVFIGDVIRGSKQDFEVDLNVMLGDFIGMFTSIYHVSFAPETGGYVWHFEADYIPCADQSFTPLNNYEVSVYGTGVA